MSLQREQIKEWLNVFVFVGATIGDVGCGNKPVSKYIHHTGCKFIRMDIDPDCSDLGSFDIEQGYSGNSFNAIFAIEMFDHLIDPVRALQNIREMLIDGGKFYMSVAFIYPNHGDNDGLRYSKKGLERLMERAGFSSWKIIPRVATSKHLKKYFEEEGIDHNNMEIGYFMEAIK